MFGNPFTPIFGGKPESFFGRANILNRFDRAINVRGSEDRTLFITGTRGSGKTALIEQLSMRAANAGWKTIDVSANQALQSFYRQLQTFDEKATTFDPRFEISILGSGAAASGKSTTKREQFSVGDLDILFRKACEKEPQGIFVSIDEIQKLPLDDVSVICNVFQMASRKGFDVMLVAAGLPLAWEPIIQHDGCTYLRRAVHEELNLLSMQEVFDAYSETFSRIDGLSLYDDALNALVHASSGQPYMMQLLGYHLVEYLNGHKVEPPYLVSVGDVEQIKIVALEAYRRRALVPLLDAMLAGEREYLLAMAKVADESRVSDTGQIAESLGKTHQQVAPYRKALIDNGIIVPFKRGSLRFNIPFLREYMLEEPDGDSGARLLDEWDI